MLLTPTDIFYIILGLLTVAVTFYFNAHLFKRGWAGASVTALEAVYMVTALAALIVGWYFNLDYMHSYGTQAGWWHWTTLLFVNPASASGGQDLIFANVILFPLWTIVEGRRIGLRAPWMFFVMSLVTSFAFAMALYLVAQERQLRWNQQKVTV